MSRKSSTNIDHLSISNFEIDVIHLREEVYVIENIFGCVTMKKMHSIFKCKKVVQIS